MSFRRPAVAGVVVLAALLALALSAFVSSSGTTSRASKVRRADRPETGFGYTVRWIAER